MKLIIFDLDGTLINSLKDLADAVNYALKEYGCPVHDVEKYRYFVGNGIPKLIERALPAEKCSEKMILDVKSKFEQYYDEHYADSTVPYEGICDLLEALKAKGYKIAVASNKADEFTVKIADKLFGSGKFDVVCGKRSDTPKKPSPVIIENIMAEIGCKPEETVMVGDSDVDIFTARNAGIKSIGCLWGFRTEKELLDAGADHIVSSPMEILKYI